LHSPDNVRLCGRAPQLRLSSGHVPHNELRLAKYAASLIHYILSYFSWLQASYCWGCNGKMSSRTWRGWWRGVNV